MGGLWYNLAYSINTGSSDSNNIMGGLWYNLAYSINTCSSDSNIMLCPIHTADADATKLFCRVGVSGVNTNSQLVGDSFVMLSV